MERFWSKVEKTDTCWNWIGALYRNGYGSFGFSKNRNMCAHRASYILSVGEIPDGLVLDHLCKNKSCVNPLHLEPVTQGENVRRGKSDHCKHGHPLDDGNTYVRKNGSRHCKTCHRKKSLDYYYKLKGAN